MIKDNESRFITKYMRAHRLPLQPYKRTAEDNNRCASRRISWLDLIEWPDLVEKGEEEEEERGRVRGGTVSRLLDQEVALYAATGTDRSRTPENPVN